MKHFQTSEATHVASELKIESPIQPVPATACKQTDAARSEEAANADNAQTAANNRTQQLVLDALNEDGPLFGRAIQKAVAPRQHLLMPQIRVALNSLEKQGFVQEMNEVGSGLWDVTTKLQPRDVRAAAKAESALVWDCPPSDGELPTL